MQFSQYLDEWFSNFSGHESHLEDLVKHTLLESTPDFLILWVRGADGESAFPKNPQLILMLLVWHLTLKGSTLEDRNEKA